MKRICLSHGWLRRLLGLAGLGVVIVVSGCALNQAGRSEVAAVWERHQSDLQDQATRYARTPTPHPNNENLTTASAQSADFMRTPARLREYLILALENNPDIKRAEEIARAKAERIPQVTAQSDPMLMTKTLPEPIRTAEGDNFFILGVTQKLPVPEKLDRAGRIALEETRMAIADWEQARLQVITDVKRVYYRLYVVDRTIELTRENQEVLDILINAARGQVTAGKRRQEDVIRAQVELSNLESRIIDLQQQRRSAQAMLNSLLSRDPTTAVASPQPFDVRQLNIELAKLLTKAADANPQLQRLKTQIERDNQAVALAKLGWWPDFTLGFEWISMEPRDAWEPPRNAQTGQRPAAPQMSEEGSDNWAITFGFNLPIWADKIQGSVREAKRQLAASMHEYTSTKNRVHFEIEDALSRVQAQQELAKLFDNTIIPLAMQAYEESRAGYVVGKSDFQYVIDNWQKWLMFNVQYHRAIGELERSVADLEQAIGLSITEVQNSSSTNE